MIFNALGSDMSAERDVPGAKPNNTGLERAARRIFVALLIAMPSGMPLGLIGVETYLSIQLQQGVIVLLAALRLVQIFSKRWPRRREWLVLAALGYFYFVSFLSNTFFIPQPLDGWLPGLVVVVPLLLIFVFDLFDLSASEVIDGLLIATLSVGILLNIDRILPIGALNDFVHYASRYNSTRRIVLLHNEMAFVFTILLARAVSASSIGMRFWSVVGLLVLAGPVFLVSESRLVIGALIIAAATYAIFFYKSRIKVLYISGLILAGAALSPIFVNIASEYTSTLGSLSEDTSVQFRNLEIEHFRKYFDQTAGFGFGLMSDSPTKLNIVSNALYRDAALYGAAGYWMSLVDLRIYAALFQFGYIGLGFTLYLTCTCAWGAWRLGQSWGWPLRSEYGALAATILGFMISPLPNNLFTVSNTVTIGGCLIFLVAWGEREYRAAQLREQEVAT